MPANRWPRLTIALVAAGLAACGGPAVVPGGGVPRPDHVLVVIEENHSYDQIIGNSSAPYINSLAGQGASFTDSTAIAGISQPNYLALFSGATQGVTDDSCPHTFSAENLGHQLLAANIGFAGYSEDLPAPGSTVCTSGGYARKHNPWVDFDNVPASVNLPYSAFPADYATLPTVSFVVPNLANDMHDGTVAQGDGWLQQHLDGYVRWAKDHNSLLVLTWDEPGDSGGHQIPTIFVGANVKPGSYDQSINHYNLLRALQDAYGLAPTNAAPITGIS